MINITNTTYLDDEKVGNKYGFLIFGSFIFIVSLCIILQIAICMKKKNDSTCECRCKF